MWLMILYIVMEKNSIVDATNYLLTVNELSKRGEPTTEVVTKPPQETALTTIPYLPFALVGALFVGALVIQVVAKIRSATALISALVFALFAASIPAALTYVQHGTQNRTNASPQTQPKILHVRYGTPTTAIFTWSTDIPTTGGIRIWQKNATVDDAKVVLDDDRSKTTNHEVTMTNLTLGTIYAFEVLSNAEWYGDTTMPLYVHFIAP